MKRGWRGRLLFEEDMGMSGEKKMYEKIGLEGCLGWPRRRLGLGLDERTKTGCVRSALGRHGGHDGKLSWTCTCTIIRRPIERHATRTNVKTTRMRWLENGILAEQQQSIDHPARSKRVRTSERIPT